MHVKSIDASPSRRFDTLPRQSARLIMLRITTAEKEDSIVFSIEGRLCGAWADEARSEWLRLRERVNGHPVVLDLAGVTYVDPAGERLLAEILSTAVRVHSHGVLISHIVERVRAQALSNSVE